MNGHIAALSDSVTRKKVVYKNRYGLEIMGELYYAKDMDLTRKHPALIVGAPYGGVKGGDQLVTLLCEGHFAAAPPLASTRYRFKG